MRRQEQPAEGKPDATQTAQGRCFVSSCLFLGPLFDPPDGNPHPFSTLFKNTGKAEAPRLLFRPSRAGRWFEIQVSRYAI